MVATSGNRRQIGWRRSSDKPRPLPWVGNEGSTVRVRRRLLRKPQSAGLHPLRVSAIGRRSHQRSHALPRTTSGRRLRYAEAPTRCGRRSAEAHRPAIRASRRSSSSACRKALLRLAAMDPAVADLRGAPLRRRDRQVHRRRDRRDGQQAAAASRPRRSRCVCCARALQRA